MTGFGLCDACAWQRIVRSGRGSIFTMCGRHREDERFPKYPRVPVAACSGFARREEARAGRADDGRPADRERSRP